jgi:hypothetical protein
MEIYLTVSEYFGAPLSARGYGGEVSYNVAPPVGRGGTLYGAVTPRQTESSDCSAVSVRMTAAKRML